MALYQNSWSPFGHILNWSHPSAWSYYDKAPMHTSLDALICHWFGKIRNRPDKHPRKNFFLWQRQYMSWMKYRKRLLSYALLTFGAHVGFYQLRRQMNPDCDGRGLYAAVSQRMYTNYGMVTQQYLSRDALFSVWSRVVPMLPYNMGRTLHHFDITLDHTLKTAAEVQFEKEAMSRLLTGDHYSLLKKSIWVRNLDGMFLPVGHNVSLNRQCFEALCKGVNMLVDGAPRKAVCQQFALIENANKAANEMNKIPMDPSGRLDLRFAYKWCQLKFFSEAHRAKCAIARPWELGRGYHWTSQWGLVTWFTHYAVVGLALGFTCVAIDDWKMKNNADLLARFGAADDERPLAERKTEAAAKLAAEARSGKWTFREEGWVNGMRMGHYNGGVLFWSDDA